MRKKITKMNLVINYQPNDHPKIKPRKKKVETVKFVPFDELGRIENWKLHLPRSEDYSRGSRTKTYDKHSVIMLWIYLLSHEKTIH